MLQAVSPALPQSPVRLVQAEFYGVPAEHDEAGNQAIPFFTNPTVCNGQPLQTKLYMDSWKNPGAFNADGTPHLEGPDPASEGWASASSESPAVTGCTALRFQPPVSGCDQLRFKLIVGGGSEFHMANSPTSFDVDIEVPEHGSPAA